jgi:predicted small integral membrane protein
MLATKSSRSKASWEAEKTCATSHTGLLRMAVVRSMMAVMVEAEYCTLANLGISGHIPWTVVDPWCWLAQSMEPWVRNC